MIFMPFISLGLSSDAWFTHCVFGSCPGSEAWHIRLFLVLLQVSATNSFYRFLFSIPDVLTFTCFAKSQGPFCSWSPSTSSFLNLECHLSTPPPPEATWHKSKIEQYWQIILKQAFKRQCVVCVCVCVCVCNVLYDICDFFSECICVCECMQIHGKVCVFVLFP